MKTDKEFEVFEKLTEGFGFGKLQDLNTLNNHLNEHDYTIDDVSDYVGWKISSIEKQQEKDMAKYEKEIRPSQEALHKVLPECPECDDTLNIYQVSQEPGRGNDRGYKSVWQCVGEDCFYEKYNTDSALDIVSGLVGEKHAETLGYRG